MHSHLYRGRVEHRRVQPVEHRFDYPLAWLYLDLDEASQIIERSWLLTSKRLSIASFYRPDHLGPTNQPLIQSVRELLSTHGVDAQGPIRLLTQLRHFGVYFSPVNFFFCFEPGGQTLDAVVAEVSNTPWNERHCYVLHRPTHQHGTTYHFRHPKTFHVSPFMQMDLEYDWKLAVPDQDLRLSLTCKQNDQPMLHTAMKMQRQPLTDATLARALARFPLAAAQILAAIHFQALRLWLKKCPFYPHPNKRRPAVDPSL